MKTIKQKTKDLSGKIFGELKAIRIVEKNKKGVIWECICSCGNITNVPSSRLLSGKTKSCGHLKRAKKIERNLIGKCFGRLTVIQHSDKNKYWLCQCECGNKKTIRGHDLVRGSVISCGCLSSKGEYLVRQILLKNNILFDTQYSFQDLKSDKNYPLKFDFAIFNQDKRILCLIEYQGEQHDISYEKYHINFGKQQREITDKQKKQYCIKNKIPFFEIWYYQDIEEEIIKILQQLHADPVPSL